MLYTTHKLICQKIGLPTKGPNGEKNCTKKAEFGWLQSTETTFVITNKMGPIEEWIYGGWLQRNVTHTLWKSIKTEVGYEDLIS